jgi:hypothetical protein
MRRITILLAALLSLLMVSTPVSAWACDMSCSLHRMHSVCQTAESATPDNHTVMSMSEKMDMGSDQSEPMTGARARVNATPNHPMSMSSVVGMAPKRFDSATQSHSGTSAMPDHSKTVSSCTHEPCSQISASTFRPSADQSQPNSPHWTAISMSSPANLWIGFQWIRIGTPPPKLLATLPLRVTTLRI